MNSRFLHAAARGARIEMRSYDAAWETISKVQRGYTGDDLYIHPDDEHLQYGPISTAIRKSAVNPWNSEGTWAVGHGTWWMDLPYWLKWDECKDELHRSLFLLILSEALADEGM